MVNRSCKIRLCIIYIVTFGLLFLFFSYLMFCNKNNLHNLLELKEDVSCISKLVLQREEEYAKSGGQANIDIGCISGEKDASSGSTFRIGCDPGEMQAYVDSIVKPKLNTLMDDVYSLKNQLINSDCSSQSRSTNIPTTITNSRVNYAADELGARINHVLAKPIGGSSVLKTVLGLDFNANPPINLLRFGLTPGACFGFQGAKATVSIRLAKAIIVEEIALTHVSKEMTPMASVDNAPKDFVVYGLLSSSGKQELLGQWVYNNDPMMRTQGYRVNNSNVFQNLVFVFSSNHGANTTCIYGVEVYGKLN